MMFDLIPFETRRRNALFNPFRELDQLEKAFFGNSTLSEFKTDIKDLGDAFSLEADLPGFKKEDIKVDLDGDLLTISASRTNEAEKKDENGRYLCRERSFGAFTRRFDVSNVKTEEIDAKYQDGVLTLTLPKREPSRPQSRSIEIG